MAEETHQSCLFCKIASGELAARIVFEDDGARILKD